MEFGAHLPQMLWERDEPPSIARLIEFAGLANELGLSWLTANDHIVHRAPWLDGPTALATVLPFIGEMRVATSVSLPVVRGPSALAKTMAAIDRFSGGRLSVGVGPGSSERDYRAIGIPWEERWPRFEEAVEALRALLRPGSEPFRGAFYSTDGMKLLPPPLQPGGPPIWIGSWGSDAGLRRVARLADGWLASGYNATPEAFGETLDRLRQHLRAAGRDEGLFTNTVATLFLHVTEHAAAGDAILADVLSPALQRPHEELRERVLVGPAEECAERLARYADAGAERVFVWPVGDALRQLERFRDVLAKLGER